MNWLLLILAWVVVIAVFMILKAVSMKPEEIKISALHDVDIDGERAAKNLSEAIKCKTISRPDPNDVDWTEFEKLVEYMEKAYPLVHKNLKKEVIADHSLLYTWAGSDETLKPIALMAHMDVVPVMPGTEGDWEHDAFSGHNDGTFLWGSRHTGYEAPA